MKKINSYFYVKFLIILKAIITGKISILKIINAIHCQFAYLLRLKKSGKSPIVISVDLWNECNENCVFCRSEKGEIYDLKTKGETPIIKGKLEIEYFKKIVDETFKTTIMIVPYINGEPLMYKGIYEAIQYANSKKMFTLIASNGILLNKNNSEKLIESGLDFLKVHISGMTKEVHSIQHRKGDVELILNNLKRIVDLKKEHKSNITLMLDYILYNHNKHELELAREFAKNYNMIFNIRPGNPAGMEETEGSQYKSPIPTSACDWPWKALSVNWNADLLPCCEYVNWSGKSPYPNMKWCEVDLKKFWNGDIVEKFRSSHIKFGRKKIDICSGCPRQGIGFKF